jgi:hypothetical protein
MEPRMKSPNPPKNGPDSLDAHRLSVLTEFTQLFHLIERALRESALKAKDFFLLADGPVDLSVHAAWTRYLCKMYLAAQCVVTEVEEECIFEMGKIPNCGLCLSGNKSQLRILKATANGVPKASSDARSRFYCSNQYLLPFDAPKASMPPAELPLSLIVLWSLNNEFEFKGMEIACPKREREDGSVECYWITEWQGDLGSTTIEPVSPSSMGPDLDEIRAIKQNKRASS